MTTPGEPTKKIDHTRPLPAPPVGGAGSPGTAGPGVTDAGPTTPAPPTGPTPPAGPAPAERRRGVGYSTYAITVLVLLLTITMIVFVVQNDQRVNIWLFGSTHNMSLAGALAASAAAGLVIGLLIGLITQIKVRKELRQYRRGKHPAQQTR
ncbi:lipopolysaccharide assembly protein LapA domain-containing protein [Candidatus Protofrankia californiensis]|uniref:lipopolysaccharide assembly protein LapA domain-containing protein n=1 Tax=Candidatus Protofrankia californiensis TaxID=1839754 RepID=UPI0010410368|nr:lipopolysaccharide assembly protein LapA domain-containing protein [Candidatus Protofrankia californiensis]